MTGFAEKSMTDSVEADEAVVMARAQKRAKTISDGSSDATYDWNAAYEAHHKKFHEFRRSDKFTKFRKRVLAEPAKYKQFRDVLEKKYSFIEFLLSVEPPFDPLLRALIASIGSGESGRLSPEARIKIVEDSEEYKLFQKQMQEEPKKFNEHWDTLRKNNLFVWQLLNSDDYCYRMMDEYYDFPSPYDVENAIERVVEKPDPEIRETLKRIQDQTRCSVKEALQSLRGCHGSEEEAVKFLLDFSVKKEKVPRDSCTGADASCNHDEERK